MPSMAMVMIIRPLVTNSQHGRAGLMDNLAFLVMMIISVFPSERMNAYIYIRKYPTDQHQITY